MYSWELKSAKMKDDLFRFGTWNVRSLKEKEMEVIVEMKKYKLEVWGSVIGRNGEGLKNDSGGRLLRFCAEVLCCE